MDASKIDKNKIIETSKIEEYIPKTKQITPIMENIYKEGEVVSERTRPNQKLIVKRYSSNMYYCQAEESATRRELVYLERDLMPSNLFRK